MPLWVGAFFIGLMEFFTGHDMTMMGFTWGGMYLFNSLWFMLLFVPSLYYSPMYRKAVFIVFSITTVLNIISMLWQTISMMMLDDEMWTKMKGHYVGEYGGGKICKDYNIYPDADVDIGADIGAGFDIGGAVDLPDIGGDLNIGGDLDLDIGGAFDVPDVNVEVPDVNVDVEVAAPTRYDDDYVHQLEKPTATESVGTNSDMWIGDTAATKWVWRYLYNNGMKQHWNKPDEYYGCEWNEMRWDDAFMSFFMQLWFGLVFIRIYYNIVIMKWCNEAGWIKTASDEEAADSHPCRPTVCCQGICM
jgi:hypothetical protein